MCANLCLWDINISCSGKDISHSFWRFKIPASESLLCSLNLLKRALSHLDTLSTKAAVFIQLHKSKFGLSDLTTQKHGSESRLFKRPLRLVPVVLQMLQQAHVYTGCGQRVSSELLGCIKLHRTDIVVTLLNTHHKTSTHYEFLDSDLISEHIIHHHLSKNHTFKHHDGNPLIKTNFWLNNRMFFSPKSNQILILDVIIVIYMYIYIFIERKFE